MCQICFFKLNLLLCDFYSFSYYIFQMVVVLSNAKPVSVATVSVHVCRLYICDNFTCMLITAALLPKGLPVCHSCEFQSWVKLLAKSSVNGHVKYIVQPMNPILSIICIYLANSWTRLFYTFQRRGRIYFVSPRCV